MVRDTGSVASPMAADHSLGPAGLCSDRGEWWSACPDDGGTLTTRGNRRVPRAVEQRMKDAKAAAPLQATLVTVRAVPHLTIGIEIEGREPG